MQASNRSELSWRPCCKEATARLNAHRVMVKKKRKGTEKHKKGQAKKPEASRSVQGKQRQERRDGWNTCSCRPRIVIKVPEGAVLRGCKKTKLHFIFM
ncbi:hypothetical protein HaLaN_30019, partial [Haematococcus lacustris]